MNENSSAAATEEMKSRRNARATANITGKTNSDATTFTACSA